MHSQAFSELALILNCAFRALGFHAPIVTNFEKITNYPVILGCNLIPSADFYRLPEISIMYNLEQILLGSPWITENYLNLLRSYEVWDYSKKNISELNKLGVANVKYCRIGYVPELTRINPASFDIDFLWYGSLNERRAQAIQHF